MTAVSCSCDDFDFVTTSQNEMIERAIDCQHSAYSSLNTAKRKQGNRRVGWTRTEEPAFGVVNIPGAHRPFAHLSSGWATYVLFQKKAKTRMFIFIDFLRMAIETLRAC